MFLAVKSKNAVGMSTIVAGCGSKMISFLILLKIPWYVRNAWKNVATIILWHTCRGKYTQPRGSYDKNNTSRRGTEPDP